MATTNSFRQILICISLVGVVSLVQCRNTAHISGSLGIIDDIMHYGTHNVSTAVQETLNSDLKSDELIFVETKPVDRSDFVHWDFDNDEIVKVKEGKYVCEQCRIDMGDFVKLMPSEDVKGLVARYYHNDKEVQKSYTYLQSKEFGNLKEKILGIPEVNNFLKYLNSSGLDLLNFAYSLVNITGRPEEYSDRIDKNANLTMPVESLNGLHGLVDSILDVLPQDQILSLFFDKLETNEEFSKLVENIGSPEFERILNKLQNSIALRNLVYTLHNNGIYITRIVDSLKAYFFLGTF